KYLPEISLMIDYLKPKTILDYGCGKGVLVDLLSRKYPDIKVYGYDPSVPGKNKLPKGKIDLVINTDVLEHIPSEILPSVLKNIAKISKNVIFMLHHALAYAILENGENAHCTVRPSVWYQNQIMQIFGDEISVFSGRRHCLSVITTFPVHPHIMDSYYKILFNTDKNTKKPRGLKRLWTHLRKMKF
ncbi:MAG: class I SAM-dependent methyltransferase, partial [Alphaproteobacteria bacterium]